MPRCAFLTMDDPAGYVIDDHLAGEPLQSLGWEVDSVAWRTPSVPWGSYDVAVIRSTWDYQEDPEEFLAVLGEIDRSGTTLFNPLSLVQWNIRKTYLRDLAARGVSIVPTVWLERLNRGELPQLFERMACDELVIKPVVGANAGGAYRVERSAPEAKLRGIEQLYATRALMAQPFVPAIVTEGEYSLLYFNGQHSHTVLKTPKDADFRVQEEHGGLIRLVRAERGLLQAGDAAVRAIGEPPLYARADFVRAGSAGWWLVELELIEPALYLRMDAGAPARFARAIHERVARETE